MPLKLIQYGEWAQMYWTYCCSPIFGPDGKVVGILNIAQDVTAQKLAEEQMQEAKVSAESAILLDVVMPQMDGWSVLNALKSDPELERIPVVMVTFVDEPGLGESLGAVETVRKPVQWERLKSVMERFHGDTGDILIVDDDADARARLRTVLERNGWTVSEAKDGQNALDMVMHSPPQLILLDLTTPVMDGFAFLH